MNALNEGAALKGSTYTGSRRLLHIFPSCHFSSIHAIQQQHIRLKSKFDTVPPMNLESIQPLVPPCPQRQIHTGRCSRERSHNRQPDHYTILGLSTSLSAFTKGAPAALKGSTYTGSRRPLHIFPSWKFSSIHAVQQQRIRLKSKFDTIPSVNLGSIQLWAPPSCPRRQIHTGRCSRDRSHNRQPDYYTTLGVSR